MHASTILRRRLCGFTLLTLVFLTFLGHIAPLPSSAHSPFTATATAYEQSKGDTGASHLASCDATLSRPAPSSSCTGDDEPWAVRPVMGIALPLPTAVTPAMGSPSRADGGPPLFLLHASFLI
jgi:hypothetical protein